MESGIHWTQRFVLWTFLHDGSNHCGKIGHGARVIYSIAAIVSTTAMGASVLGPT
jgi:hypothetical protein